MNLSKTAPAPENTYLSPSEYAAILGIAIASQELVSIDLAAVKICTFGGIQTLQTMNPTTEPVTAYPVTILAALFDLYLYASTPSPVD